MSLHPSRWRAVRYIIAYRYVMAYTYIHQGISLSVVGGFRAAAVAARDFSAQRNEAGHS